MATLAKARFMTRVTIGCQSLVRIWAQPPLHLQSWERETFADYTRKCDDNACTNRGLAYLPRSDARRDTCIFSVKLLLITIFFDSPLCSKLLMVAPMYSHWYAKGLVSGLQQQHKFQIFWEGHKNLKKSINFFNFSKGQLISECLFGVFNSPIEVP